VTDAGSFDMDKTGNIRKIHKINIIFNLFVVKYYQ